MNIGAVTIKDAVLAIQAANTAANGDDPLLVSDPLTATLTKTLLN